MPGWLKRGRLSYEEPEKPLLRGYIHKVSFFLYLCAGLIVLSYAQTDLKRMAFFVYLMSSLCLYATSSVFHTTSWHDPEAELELQKLDHCAIILQIAGTYTPVCTAHMPSDALWPNIILGTIWALTLLGTMKSFLWKNPPKIFNVLFYFTAGLSIIPYMPTIIQHLTFFEWGFFALGGAVYLTGGMIYGLERPDPNPKIFGFHEIFHCCTILANLCFFVPIAWKCMFGN